MLRISQLPHKTQIQNIVLILSLEYFLTKEKDEGIVFGLWSLMVMERSFGTVENKLCGSNNL
jgi:hypothetical protein